MNRLFTVLIIAIIAFSIECQAATKKIIKGVVTHSDGKEPLVGANVFIKDSYDGATTNTQGEFLFKTSKSGKVILIARYIGHEQYEKEIELTDTVNVRILLKDMSLRSETVVVTAGAIEAGDEAKAVVFSSLDIASTAGSGSDIVMAFQTLPGVTKVGESSGLFVRGGEGRETAVWVDGSEVKHPFYTNVPDVSSRGRFSPFYFKGTFFSTGGYSAEYGRGLSSAMILNTIDLPEISYTHIDLMPLGIGAGHNERWENSSFGLDLSYFDLGLYDKFNSSKLDWISSPKGGQATMNYRLKTAGGGMIKSITNAGFGTSHLNLASVKSTEPLDYKLDNTNVFSSLYYSEGLSENLILTAGSAYAFNKDKNKIFSNDSSSVENQLQAKAKLTYLFGELSTLNFGGEFSYFTIDKETNISNYGLIDRYTAVFTEADLPVSNDLAFRLGIRGEYSTFTEKFVFAPRFSAALKLSENGTLSAAAGRFYQSPEYIYFPSGRAPGFESAEHYILNYQMISPKRTLRAEMYYKNYSGLVRMVPDLSVGGTGYAAGLDLFWRDKETIDNFDYWISYSYLDTKRKYMDYPVEAMPGFAANHSFSAVFKALFPSVNINIAMTYQFLSGRPYYNPNNPVFLGDRTKSYNNISLSGYYLTQIFGAFTVVVVSAENIFGIDNIFTYNYSPDGASRSAVRSPYPRTFFFGVFISFGRDNSDDY